MVGDNASVSIKRLGSYNAGTKTTAAPTQVATGVSCFIRDISRDLRARGFAVEFDFELSCETTVDLRDNDLITGWNPSSLTQEPTYVAGHVAVSQGGLGAHKTALLKAYRTAS